MIAPASHTQIIELMRTLGDIGVFVAMFLESSIVPIPSEVIIIGAGAIGIPFLSVTIFGSLGATSGAAVGYLLGRYAAMPIIIRYGKFILIKPHHIYKAEAFAKRYGIWSVLIGRLVPFIPFKVFSIAAGITRLPFPAFIVCTFIGVVPRIIILTLFGESIVKYTKPTIIVVAFIVLIFISYKITRGIYDGKKNKK